MILLHIHILCTFAAALAKSLKNTLSLTNNKKTNNEHYRQNQRKCQESQQTHRFG
jgi:hypothetical protein